LNESRLEKRLRFALDCTKVVWRKEPFRSHFAQVTADKGNKVVVLPLGHDDDFTLRTLFHELCHVAIPGELGAFGAFEEDILERVLEPRLMEHLLNRPRKHSWWLKKLAETREEG
jgi:hypothetical protein